MKNDRTFRERLPLVLSSAALLISLLGFTPLGEAARNAVPIALFAKNAAKVNGIKASRTPKAGQLVPLAADGKFPDSIGVAGPRGPEGDRGPQGSPGPTGPSGAPASSFWAVVNADGSLYKSSGVLGIEKTGAGRYQVTFIRNVDDCAAVASAGGHKTGADTWTDIVNDPGIATVATFGQLVVVRLLAYNGFAAWQPRDFNFHVAVVC